MSTARASEPFERDELLARRLESGRAYPEFLRVPALSAGMYVLAAGTDDKQQPHREDEVYYVVSGRAKIDVDGDVRAVQAGSIVYVAATVPHRFVDIEEELSVLVLFAPAEGAQPHQ